MVVVGSGYGGSVAASVCPGRAAVCVLERGREISRGLSAHFVRCDGEIQAVAHAHMGSRTGLYDFHVNQDMNVLVGCGLGGTSLINANVALKAEKRVFEDARWPEEILADYDTSLAEGYSRANEMLKPVPYPESSPPLKKMDAHQKSAGKLNGKFYRPPIAVTFQDGVNHVGVEQKACVNCGDCVSGCNYTKNTLLMNYLPDARNFGAEIFTRVSVRKLVRKSAGGLPQALEYGQEKFGQRPSSLSDADMVVLAAGTLGSTEILLRSKSGLELSNRLGHGFTGNGDVLAFGYNCDNPWCRHGHMDSKGRMPVGPTITSIIDMRQQPGLDDGMVIEEGAMPGPLAPLYAQVLAAASSAFGKDTDGGLWDMVRERAREMDSLLHGAYKGAVQNPDVPCNGT